MYAKKEIISLIDKHLSLQWCRENVVIPLRIEAKTPPEESILIIAVGNISYLGTIGNLIKERVGVSSLTCKFVEKSADQINELLDRASEERFVSGEGVELTAFNEEADIEALKDTASDTSLDEFSIEFDDFGEFLNKSVLIPNNINFPLSRNEFIKLI